MHLTRLDDYQSWLLQIGGRRIAIDPWLTARYCLSPGAWLLERTRAAPRFTPADLKDIDALALTAPYADHLDPDSLAQVPRDLPVLAPASAGSALRSLGFTQVSSPPAGQTVSLAGVAVRIVPSGFPFAWSTRGYLWQDGDGRVLYHEPHAIPLSQAQRLGRVSVVLTSVQGVRLVGLPLVMSAEHLSEALRVLKPDRLVPTGSDPQTSHGLLQRFGLSTKGTEQGFGEHLPSLGIPTRFSALAPGETIEI